MTWDILAKNIIEILLAAIALMCAWTSVHFLRNRRWPFFGLSAGIALAGVMSIVGLSFVPPYGIERLDEPAVHDMANGVSEAIESFKLRTG
jgi:hypothetical protein